MAPSDPSRRADALADPRILPFLPLVYLAWADGELSEEEIQAICGRLTAQLDLEGGCRSALGEWLNPAAPPTAGDLAALLSTLRHAAGKLANAGDQSLAELGLQLQQQAGSPASAAERRALGELEAALGLSGPEATRQILLPKRSQALAAPIPARFDVQALAQILHGHQEPLRSRILELLATPPFAPRYGEAKEAFRRRTLERLHILAREGLGCLGFPAADGGQGDTPAFITAFETLSYGDLSLVIKFGVQFGLFGGSIQQLGTEGHHRRYLPAVGTLQLPGCFAMSEAGHGSNVRDIETTAHYDPQREEFILHTPDENARKDWIGNAAADGQLATVFAQLHIGDEEFGVHAFLVPIRHPDGRLHEGVDIDDCGEKLGLNGVDNGRIRFHQVRVPRENLLDRFAQVAADGTYSSPIASPSKRFFTMLGTLVGGRVSVALAALSATKTALTIAVRYGQRRRQFGAAGAAETRVLDYLTHQRRLLPRLAKTYALHFALHRLTELYARGQEADGREVETLAAGLKAYSSWHAVDTLQTCRECCGGQGYLAVNRFAALKADSDIFTTFEGDNTVLLQLVAKGLLTGYKKQFTEMNLLGMMRLLGQQAATTLTELNPVVTRRQDEDHLRDPDFHLAAMAWREQHLLASLARRLRKRVADGMDSHEAIIACQDHMVSLALAMVEHLLIRHFNEAVTACPQPELRTPLKNLRDLFALERLEADRGWFLSQGYLEPAKSKAIRNLVNRLCTEIRPDTVPLVDAFGIPDAVLAAPIALGDLESPVALDPSRALNLASEG